MSIIINISNDIQSNANLISKIDIFSSLAYLAINNKYIRPIINEEFSLKIHGYIDINTNLFCFIEFKQKNLYIEKFL